jgi:hypothetical protein
MILGGVLDVLSGARLVLAALRRRRGEAPVAPAEPGQLLRHEEITKDVPDGATGWRILYTTTRDEVEAALASALVVVPDAAEGPVPVIAWAHGTTGVARRCAPTIMPSGLEAGAFHLTDQVLDWADRVTAAAGRLTG